MTKIFFPFIRKNPWYGMDFALKAAHKELGKKATFHRDEIPVGSAIMIGDQCIAVATNAIEKNCSIVYHAEIQALMQASCVLKSKYLFQCDLFVTLEPCPMCAYAIAQSKIRRLVFGAYNPKSGAIEHNICLFRHFPSLYSTEVIGGVQEKACEKLIHRFFSAIREGS